MAPEPGRLRDRVRGALREPGPGVQHRFESTRLGQALISTLIVVTLAGVVVQNMPQSKLRRDALTASRPFLNAVGLEQTWGVFAPDPRRESIALRALIRYADGSSDVWRTPSGNAVIGSYWDYHWQKWQEWVLDEHHPQLWRPAAIFIARARDHGGRRPVRVTLVRETSRLNPPGHRPSREAAVATRYYSLRITRGMLGSSRPL